MSVSAEMYIVISLMFAVFAAVAAIGTSVVLGVGFERLRAGFEIVKKQTGFFADAIHKLDERTKEISAETAQVKKAVAGVSERVNKVEKTTSFFFESLNTLESQILKGQPAKVEEKLIEEVSDTKKTEKPLLPKIIEWGGTSEARHLLQANQDRQEPEDIPREEAIEEMREVRTLKSSIIDYFLTENRGDVGKGVVYH